MKYQTEMMRSILTNEKAQEIIGYVSSIYGNSYVGLWIYQAIGTVLDEVCKIAEQLRNETNPASAELLLDLWEDHYGIPRDRSLTTAQRQIRIIAKTQTRGPCNPVKVANAVSAALGGARVKITENIAKNTFRVDIMDSVDSIIPALAVLERMAPAHLIYQVRVANQAESAVDIKTAVAMTYSEHYRVEVLQ